MTKGIMFSVLLVGSEAIDYMKLDPCRLMCHMEHTIDECKLVTSKSDICANYFWLDTRRNSTIVDKVPDEDFVQIYLTDAINILKVNKGGCEAICKAHADCVDSGSECKLSGVCLNLFWNPGTPVRTEMSTCYQRSEEGCNDGTPILCGNEPSPKRHDSGLSREGSSDNHHGDQSDDCVHAGEVNGKTGPSQVPKAANANGAYSQLASGAIIGSLIIPFFTRW